MRKERNEKQTAANEVASVRETSVAATQYVERKDAEREQTLVSEINLITEQTKQALLTGTIEIGKRLTEAKCLVRHGEWGNWLAERVNYSQRSANNFMKIYKEYGATGLAAKSQSIANLSVTQAVAMFDLPAEERERFAEQNEADKMSIRQLKAEVAKAKEELEAEKSSTKEALEQCKKNHEAEIAHYKQMTQSAVSKREEIEAQLKAERKHLEELSASQDEKAKEQVDKERGQPFAARAQHREPGERGRVQQGDRGVPEDRVGAEQNPKGGGAALHRYAASCRHRPDRQRLYSRHSRWDPLYGELRPDRTGRQVAVQPGRPESKIARYYGLLL